ncbi:MAG: amidohydrolase family protein [Candidatus Heimdallarchaeota archaeon]
MKKLIFILLLNPLFILCSSEIHQENSIAFTNVTIINPDDSALKSGMIVIVQGNRISLIGKTEDVKIPHKTKIINASGKYIIPGLWDMHVHIVRDELDIQCRDIYFSLFITNGITGVRDVGSDWGVLKQWRNDIELGKLLGPQIVSSGPILWGYPERSRVKIPINNPTEGRQTIDSLKNEGVDFIKVLEGISKETFYAIADEANKLGLSFVGHVPFTLSAAEVSDAGMRSIEHLTGVLLGCSTREEELGWTGKDIKYILETYSEQKADLLFRRFAENNTWQCPTLVLFNMKRLIGGGYKYSNEPPPSSSALLRYFPDRWEEAWKGTLERMIQRGYMLDNSTSEGASINAMFHKKQLEAVGKMHQVGVEFLAGTDCPAGPYLLPGFSLHNELELLVESGLTPMEALQTATLKPAEFLGMLDSLGTIEKGKIANLVLLDANPLEDISNTQKINSVVLNGNLFTRSDLDKKLAEVETAVVNIK